MRYWSIGLIGWLGLGSPVMAQSIVPTDSTQVEQSDAGYRITGGQQSSDGLNLFHGFERFNLGQSEQANFQVPAGVANVLGRISGGEASLINGQLQLVGSNADLFLLNPAGIIFGREATLALPGNFLATTADSVLFDSGTFPAVGSVDYASLVGEPTGLAFFADAGGTVVNSGELEVTKGASISLLGTSVVNTGSLLSSDGSVTLAAVPAERGHYVRLSTAGSVLTYDVAHQQLTSSFNPLDLPELLTDSSVASATGLVVNPNGSLQLAGSNLDLAAGMALSTGSSTGGEIQLLGGQVGLLAGEIVGDNIWIGGSQEGRGPLPNASAVYMAPDASIRADAQGNDSGGNIIIWSEESSRIYGLISAQGGERGGNGGFVETSSRGFLDVTQVPDVSAVQGAPGLWLIDPFDIEIRDNGGDNANLPAGSPFEATGSLAVLDVNLLAEALSNGSVVVSTGNGGSDNGDITLIDPLNYVTGPGTTLELLAAGDIAINAAIAPAAPSSPLNLQLLADRNSQGNGVVTIADVVVDTAGGSFLANGNGEQLTDAAGVSLFSGSNIQTNGGDITLFGRHGSGPGILIEADSQINAGETGQISLNGISNTGIAIDLENSVTTNSTLLTLDGRVGSNTQIAIQSTSPLSDNDVRLNAFGDIEVDYIETPTDIDITTTNFLRVTGVNGAGQSLSAPNSIQIRHGGDGQTPFVVGDAAVNGTEGAIATNTTTIIPIQSFTSSFSQGNISIVTNASDPIDCVEGCNDFIDDELADDEFADSDFGDEDILDDSFSDDALNIDDGENGETESNSDFENGGDFEEDSDFEDDSDFEEDGDFEDNFDQEEEDNDSDSEEDDEEDSEDSDFDDDEFEYEDDGFFEILDDAEITSEELAAKEKVISQEYSQYLGVRAERDLPLPEVQEKLNQVAVETGYTPGIVYVDFVPDNQERSKQLLELNQENYRLELVLVTADAPSQRILVDIPQAEIRGAVIQLQRQITNPSSPGRRYLRSARRLHSWLIAPLEKSLTEHRIDHLAFVLPAGLRSLPIAALHNGDSFLIERYSLGIMPSVGLTNIDYSDVRPAEVLATGASVFADQPALPAVPLELRTIADNLWPGRFFLNESFTLEQILANRQRNSYGILHLATHGEFRAGEPGNSYIQFWDRRVTLDQLPSLSLDDPPVELLVLSACRTALGSREAELGFAGLAVQAGVKTAMASLWKVDDVGTAGLMTEFYANLRNSTMRAEALRQAQLAMIRGEVNVEAGELSWTGGTLSMPPALADETRILSHPFYWAAFTLIGSPW